MLENKVALHPEWDNVDSLAFMDDEYAELPELTDEMFARMKFMYKGKEISREEGLAAFRNAGRPPSLTPKIMTSIRFSQEVMAYFKASGRGWQTRMDAALKEWIAQQQEASAP